MPNYRINQVGSNVPGDTHGNDPADAAINYCRRRFQIMPDEGLVLQIEQVIPEPPEPCVKIVTVRATWIEDKGMTWTAELGSSLSEPTRKPNLCHFSSPEPEGLGCERAGGHDGPHSILGREYPN